jgi:hypothetical protein
VFKDASDTEPFGLVVVSPVFVDLVKLTLMAGTETLRKMSQQETKEMYQRVVSSKGKLPGQQDLNQKLSDELQVRLSSLNQSNLDDANKAFIAQHYVTLAGLLKFDIAGSSSSSDATIVSALNQSQVAMVHAVCFVAPTRRSTDRLVNIMKWVEALLRQQGYQYMVVPKQVMETLRPLNKTFTKVGLDGAYFDILDDGNTVQPSRTIKPLWKEWYAHSL